MTKQGPLSESLRASTILYWGFAFDTRAHARCFSSPHESNNEIAAEFSPPPCYDCGRCDWLLVASSHAIEVLDCSSRVPTTALEQYHSLGDTLFVIS
jgi:hypothetical protein